ncbi:MAG: GyrI-like domain-containing protein [Simkaniaceae bacterium]|nr:GyrI-like domain-containing protein [Simkaniaceae bacterium]
MRAFSTILATLLAVSGFSMEQVSREETKMIGIEIRTSNAPEAAPIDIPKHWEKFSAENIFERIPNKKSHDVIGLYCEYEGDFTQPYTFVIGCEVESLDDIPEGMVGKMVPASKYARFPVSGDFPQSLINTWKRIWQTDLQRTYTCDFELYGEKFQGEGQELDIYIAVE